MRALLFLLTLVLPPSSDALPVSISFEGVVDHTEDQYGVLPGVSVGTGFLGTIRFDGNMLSGPLGVASPPLSAPERYLGWFDEASRWLLDVVVGELAISLVSSAQVPVSNMSLSDEPDGYGMVIYDGTAVPDVRVVSGQLNFNPSGSPAPEFVDLSQVDGPRTIAEMLPGELEGIPLRFGAAYSRASATESFFSGPVSSIEILVPEPTECLLLALAGLAACFPSRKRCRRVPSE